MLGFAVLLLCYFAGVMLNRWLGIPLPGNVIGLVLMLLALYFKIVKLEWVEKAGEFLLKHMLLFFAPVVVGVMAFFPLIGKQWLPLCAALFGSTIVVMLAGGFLAQGLQSKSKERLDERGE